MKKKELNDIMLEEGEYKKNEDLENEIIEKEEEICPDKAMEVVLSQIFDNKRPDLKTKKNNSCSKNK